MKTALTRIVPVALLTLAAACAPDDSDGVVARAGDHTLGVDEAARMIAGVQGLPADVRVVSALSELWLDYTLLAEALHEDSTLSQLDFGPAIRGQLEQEAIMGLRAAVIAPDTVVTADELQAMYDEQTPGARVRARHILLQFPAQATPAQRDSVRSRAEEILQLLEGGADFATLAGQVSQDPGSANRGGDLGFFTRGDMVKPFEDAAFALEPGEISEVVESPFGLHIIRTEEKEVPSFDEVRDDFRDQVLARRYQVAESVYIAGLQNEASVEVPDGAADLVRQMARDPATTLSRRAANRAVVTYEGGEVTLGEVKDFLATRQGQYRQQVIQATDEVIVDQVLPGLAQRELLVQRARQEGYGADEAVADSLTTLLRRQLLEAGRAVGLADIETQGSETQAQAIDRVVEEALRAMISGQRDVVTLGPVSLVLRESADVLLARPTFDLVIEQVAQVRGPEAQVPAGTGPGQRSPPGAGGAGSGGAPGGPGEAGPPAGQPSGGGR